MLQLLDRHMRKDIPSVPKLRNARHYRDVIDILDAYIKENENPRVCEGREGYEGKIELQVHSIKED